MRFADRIKQIRPSATLGITQKAKAMKKSGVDVINFGAGEPDFDTPEYIKEAAIEAIKKGKTKYTQSAGTPELRQAICDAFLKWDRLSYEPKDIIVSNGAKHSLYNIFQATCQKGDEVMIPLPYWVSYPEMVRLSDAKVVFVTTTAEDNFKINPKSLKAALTAKTKAIIINSPSNPTGSVYNRGELEAIAEIAIDKNLIIISDEIYDRLIYDDRQSVSIASLSQRAKESTIVVNGVSKTYSMTGWRIGYIASTNNDLISAINNLQDHSSSNPSSISQDAALAALTKEDGSVERMRQEFQKRRDYMMERINGIREFFCVKPEGAFYCFVDISKISRDSLSFASRLLEEARVAVIPGEGFGAPEYIRLSFATGMEDIKEGLNRIERWLRR